MIMKCFVQHLVAKVELVNDPNEDQVDGVKQFKLSATEEDQESIYKLANKGLTFITECFPVATKNLLKIIRQSFPHFSTPSLRYVSYVKNLLLLCETLRYCRTDIFSIIVDNLSQLDAVLMKTEDSVTNRIDDDMGLNVFTLDEEYESKKKEILNNNERMEKLDCCMCYMFTYIAKIHNQKSPLQIDFDLLPVKMKRRTLFEESLFAFEDHILMAHNLKNVSFIWFYMCSLNENYCDYFLNWLWGFVSGLNQAPNDWKKGQGAACYIGSMLSRASYIDLSTALKWLGILSSWCTTYVNEMVDRTAGTAAGSARHGTFYAVFQAFLIAFCFRYCEIVQAKEINDMRRWGLGHIIHSSLEPLSYVSRPVALCFATISRSLQLVYVNHILPTTSDDRIPFESVFPFDSYSLTKSSSCITVLMRKFSPLAEHVYTLKSELQWKTINERALRHSLEEHVGSWEFLNDIERDRNEFQKDVEAMDEGESKSSFKVTDEFLTIYSSSPGLKQFSVLAPGMLDFSVESIFSSN
ncbi:unnamed protein product [Thelazia callipaeda]|uniref:RNA polymerase I-specific transcription initiation factor RRN3 n=1 Tax=Thelazia callipaeda TaxID=103827 RepID=A0A158RCI3_THECL|nr:unnamed protein product [Thelazia callipaeda]